jgi:hypothetical protein
VGFLSNLLPGLRDLRTPLVAGYAWLLGLWLTLSGVETTATAGAHLAEVMAPLTRYFGPGMVLAGLTVTAYLIGSLTQASSRTVIPGIGIAQWFANAGFRFTGVGIWSVNTLDGLSRATLAREADLERFATWALDEDHDKWVQGAFSDVFPQLLRAHSRLSASEQLILERRQATRGTTNRILDELDLPSAAVRLRIADKDLWESYDRLQAEAELRLSLGFPLMLIAWGVAGTGLWLSAMVGLLALALFASGRLRSRLATGVLLTCLVSEVFHDPRVDAARARIRAKADRSSSPTPDQANQPPTPPVDGDTEVQSPGLPGDTYGT